MRFNIREIYQLITACFELAVEHAMEGVQNNGLLQLHKWRLVERKWCVVLAMSALRSVAADTDVIAQPKEAQMR